MNVAQAIRSGDTDRNEYQDDIALAMKLGYVDLVDDRTAEFVLTELGNTRFEQITSARAAVIKQHWGDADHIYAVIDKALGIVLEDSR